jgi:site-specific DNA-methyltransferase (adenine-specific)
MIQLLHGDCLEIMSDLPDASVDMILTDLPYGTTACKWDVVIPFEPLWQQWERICRFDGAIVLTAAQPFTSQLVMSNPKCFAYAWVWDKGVGASFVQAKRMPMRVHEDVLVFSPSGKTPRYFPQMVPKDKPLTVKESKACKNAAIPINPRPAKTYTESYPRSIQSFSSRSAGSRGLHPTQKPVPLMEYLINTYTKPGEVVLDCCMGSGTTGVAAMNTGRRFIGIEREADYLAISRERIQFPEQGSLL